MNKVGIITLNGYFNYGNRLQNYALQETIKSFGFEVETIINNTKSLSTDKKNKIELIKDKGVTGLIKIGFTKVENYLYNNRLRQERTQLFKSFSSMYISETDYSISEANIPNDILDNYAYFVTGSDQVWNPNYRKGSSIEFLTFSPPERRIAYAPSFGISKIPAEFVNSYRQWLSEMAHLSVREEAGANIIKELTGRDAPVVLDPTMMLTKEKWLSISKESKHKPENKYLLTYFLGDIPKERLKKLSSIAEKNELEIVHLAQIKDRKHYLSGPSEFIDYINSASVFCTDSFHGAVFSILVDTPFIVFNREGNSPSMNSRIETLLKTFKLESRKAEDIKSNNQIFQADYSHTVPILEKERKKALDYLENALNVK
ncbi:polysaccharide pyruvyl transferase family protein [Bacillus sp. B15-48]|uniref:polysaccharide pyruvyl transferase family protein n=1 Tax=Bacillus sp. B15-48 TaxID=1548601 RepID=UPI00193F9B4A|nr:polysaccharide pyruvyl transferase family protein [Bacillus sp. B15-48]MBM4761457.1 polysaccharide pyruvyl transferase family protein [Bacillus sp. B15-48]